jgi:hypothetical protein
MKRPIIRPDPELEVLLKREVRRQRRPMAEVVREAIRAYVTHDRRSAPPGAGAFGSGRSDTASIHEQILMHTRFGEEG